MPEAHFSFGGVDVDVDLVWRAFKVHHRQGVAALHESGFVASTYGLKKGPRRHWSVVDENVDVISFPTGDVRGADPTAPTLLTGGIFILNRLVERNKFGGLRSHDVVQPVEHVVGRRYVQQGSTLRFQVKSAFWMGQGMVNHDVDNAGRFGFRSALERQTSRSVLEQVFN